jgi:glycosyltransferase involved in cell wall biosynthesis
MRKEVNFLSRDYYPDNSAVSRLITELTEYLSKDIKVNVFAGYPFYYCGQKTRKNTIKNLNIKRIWCPNLSKDNLFFRAFTEFFFTSNIFLKVLFAKKKMNIVNSLPFGLQLVALLLKIIRNQNYILINYETFPELAFHSGIINKKSLKYKALDYLNKKVIDNSEYTIAIGRCMQKKLENKTKFPEKIKFIPNWADTKKIRPIPKKQNKFLFKNEISDKFIVSFSGNLGRYIEVDSVLNTAKALQKNKDILFLFIGNGRKRKKIEEFKIKNNLNNIQIFDYLPYEQKCFSLSSGDIALILMNKGTKGVVVPSKTYELMSAGKPLIAVTEPGTEIEKIIKEAKNGYVINPGDSDSLKKSILNLYRDQNRAKLMGEISRKFVIGNFKKNLITQKYLSLIQEKSSQKT